MTPKRQNQVIAEFCGWHIEVTEYFKILRQPEISESGFCCGLHLSDGEVWNAGITGDENGHFKIPNYVGDLNAIQSAKAKLSEAQRITYIANLYHLSVPESERFPDHFVSWPQAFKMADATSQTQAEALLRTISKWEEST